jgi:hypothetical protein
MPTYQQGQSAEQTNERLQPGIHQVTCTEAEEKQSRAGNDMLVLTIQPVVNGQPCRPRMREYLVFSKAAAWRIDAAMSAFGHAVEKGANVEVTPRHFVGRSAMADLVADGEYLTVGKWLDPDPANPLVEVVEREPVRPVDVDPDADDIPF